jgi:DNA modification methylase
MDLLAEDIPQLDFDGFDIDWNLPTDDEEETAKEEHASLTDKFVVPPFSILDTRQGYWQDRKRAWKDLGIKSEIGRDAKAYSTGKIAEQYGRTAQNGTSIFDPVLCEIMYLWYCTKGGKIYDCFAGGSVRGIVAEKLGYKYQGIDIRQEQVDANNDNAKEIGVSPTWYCDDSLNVDKYIEDNSIDMVFSCPPYGDLEVYSDNPNDISNMDYDSFCRAYKGIIDKACNKLKQDRFAVFVVGDIRDKNGAYRNFIDYTKKCFNDNGLVTYNEAILIDMLGTAMIRANQTFKSRKLVKVHQNVLIFYKGNIKHIKDNFENIEIDDSVFDAEFETE